jgi:hypothetical protein
MVQKVGVKDYTDVKIQAACDDTLAFKSVKDWLTEDGKTKMRPLGEKMRDDNIKAAVAYLRRLKNKGRTWS